MAQHDWLRPLGCRILSKKYKHLQYFAAKRAPKTKAKSNNSRCAGPALRSRGPKGQTQVALPPQGRADLRAAEHSGGRLF